MKSRRGKRSAFDPEEEWKSTGDLWLMEWMPMMVDAPTLEGAVERESTVAKLQDECMSTAAMLLVGAVSLLKAKALVKCFFSVDMGGMAWSSLAAKQESTWDTVGFVFESKGEFTPTGSVSGEFRSMGEMGDRCGLPASLCFNGGGVLRLCD